MRRKGELSPARVDREYPHQVAIETSALRGADGYLHAAFPSLAPRTRFVIDERDREYTILCFADPAEAETFRQRARGYMFDRRDMQNRHVWRRPKE
ncbi:hypothetical protein [Nitratireductor thuwali]|uniref:hypothetical protein n=1 Tax=Nitratireductor thuwali TaxID=2267699 RepID=UPI0030CEC12E